MLGEIVDGTTHVLTITCITRVMAVVMVLVIVMVLGMARVMAMAMAMPMLKAMLILTLRQEAVAEAVAMHVIAITEMPMVVVMVMVMDRVIITQIMPGIIKVADTVHMGMAPDMDMALPMVEDILIQCLLHV
jgi:hypothetical protein